MYRFARSTFDSKSSTARASVRAIIIKSGSLRAVTAALIFPSFPQRRPAIFRKDVRSAWEIPGPQCDNWPDLLLKLADCTSDIFRTSKPGIRHPRLPGSSPLSPMYPASWATSVSVSRPISGTPAVAFAIPAPLTYTAFKSDTLPPVAPWPRWVHPAA